MDNDDNRYQGQNRDLVGEESSKISSVLPSYALPKFDFDDNLQVHLRFDGLVDNEVFLGIPSQEDNHWMEDFSRAGSGMEFSSSAAESCPIPRHDNVWSEATSSESVEMLLKSVGQEEMVPGESVIEESNALNGSGSSAKQMEPNFGQDEKRDDQDSNQALPALELSENVSVVNQSAGGVDMGRKCASESQEVDQSTIEGALENSSLVLTVENVQTCVTCSGENQEKADTSLNESLSIRYGEPLIISEMQSNIECSSPNMTVDFGNVSDQDKVSDKHLGGARSQAEVVCKGVEERSAPKNDYGVNDEHSSKSLAHIPTSDHDSQFYVASKVEPTEEYGGVKTKVSNLEEASSFPESEESVLPTAKGNNQDLHSVAQGCQNPPVLVISEAMETIESADKCEKSLIVSQGDGGVGTHAIVSSGVEAHGIYHDLEQAKDSLLQTSHRQSSAIEAKEICVGSPDPVDRVTVDTTSLPYVSTVDCEVHNQVKQSSKNHADDLPCLSSTSFTSEFVAGKQLIENPISTVVCEVNEQQVTESNINHADCLPSLTNTSFSAEFVAQKHKNKNPKENNDSAWVNGEAVSPSVQVGRQFSGESISSDKIDVLNNERDISVCEKRNLMIVEAPPGFQLVNDANRVSSSSLDKEIGENVGAPPGFKLINDAQRLSFSSLDKEVRENVGEHSGFKLISDGKGLLSSSLDKEVGVNVEGPPGFKLHDPMTNESVTNGGVNSTNLTSRETDITPSLSASGVTEKLTNLNEEQETPPHVVVSMDVDEKEERGVEALSEAIPNLKESLCVEGEPRIASAGENSTSNTVAVEVATRVDPSTATAEIYNAASQEERVVADKTSQRSIDRIEVDPVRCDSNLEDAGNADAVAIEKHQDTKEENNLGAVHSEVPGGGNLAEIEPSHAIASVINCTELSKPVNVALSGSTCEVGGGAVSTPMNGAVNNTSREERSFTFDVRPLTGLSEGETGVGWQPFPNIKACKTSTIEKESASTHGDNKENDKAVQDPSHATSQAPESGSPSRGAKSTSEDKKKRGSGKTGIDCGAKSTVVVSTPSSKLPDLNTSVPTSAQFHQPFTDLQQVQLRGQIFVYGSLIQGAAPEEPYMVSAFGTSDGGRIVWEPSWRTCVERLRSQKSIISNYDTPVQSRSGSKVQAHSSKQGSPQSKVPPSPASRSSSKGTPSPAVNPVIPLPSPLWNISTPSCAGLPSSSVAKGAVLDYQTLPPLHPFHTPPMRGFGGRTTSWLPQAPLPGPWVASPQSSGYGFSARFSSLPAAETVKLTAVRDPSQANSSGAKHVSTSPAAHSGGSNIVGGTSSMLDNRKTTGSPVQHSADPKSRKRKKSNITEDPVQTSVAAALAGAVSFPLITSHSSNVAPAMEEIEPISFLARNQVKSVSAPVIGGHFSTSVAVTASPSCIPESNSDKLLVAASPALLSTDHSKSGNLNMEKTAIQAEDFSKVEEAQRHAEEAAEHAASALSHCQSVWSQLGEHRNSGLTSEVEMKISSAAVMIAAAASVAKAAAAAAKIASSAAVQAKQMANEALIPNETNMASQESPIHVHNLGNATPASILNGADGNNASNSTKKVDSASAASRRAENLDAILKAAELAAEAVSQAGKVVDMGEPLPLSELVEAGPDRYWRGSQVPSGQVEKYGTENGEKEVPKQCDGPSDQQKRSTVQDRSPISREKSRNRKENNVRMEEDVPASVGLDETDLSGENDCQESDLEKASMPESGSGFIQGTQESGASILMHNGMKEGCLVEVFKDGGCFKGAWYSAEVLSLEKGKAFVCYNELQSDEGSGLLREWVPLEGDDTEVPIIRIPHPMSSMRFGRTRKRRRAAVRDYDWSVGDRVDAWIEDCWREGVIKEKSKKDETSLTVHFSAQEESSVVRVWHLRPTLTWKNGEWIEFASSRDIASSQGDTPQDKRQRLGTPAIEVKGKGKISKSTDIVESVNDDEPKLLPLSESEKVFNIGSTIDGNKADGARIKRSGLQKEGSKVFGVPEPGKKREFIEVSKHFVSEGSSKTSVSNASGKFTKSSMPQRPGSRGWKNSSKIDVKEKQVAELKSKALRSGKLQNVSSRTLPQKGNSSQSSGAVAHETTSKNPMVKESSSSDINESGRNNATDIDAAAEHAKKASKNAKSERLTKGKLAPAGGKSTKAEVKDKSISEAIEPRRSNRKIQPTSRLLEGLQSSLTISKIPSFSSDKSNRNHNKGGGSKGGK